jgi:hypothetical protein
MCVLVLVLTGISLLSKLPCTGPPPPGLSRAAHIGRSACWSDVAALWTPRDLGLHRLPYVNGTFTSHPLTLTGGTVEYPTLGGLWIWLTALPVDSARGFLVLTAVVAGVLAVAVTLLLVRLTGRRAWVFAATPPLALYAAYNWDLLPVLCTVLGVAAMTTPRFRSSPWLRFGLAGLAFGTGAAFKLYPIMFVAAIVLAALLDRDGRPLGRRVAHAGAALGGGLLVPLLANVPFALLDLDGWLAPVRFQAERATGASTLSVWYWGLLPWSSSGDPAFQHRMTALSTAATALGVLVVLAVTVVLALRRGRTPWLQSAAALLAVYMVCNKVDSLQYVLWLVPFFVVLRVGGWWVTAYLLADLAAFVGWFRSQYYGAIGQTALTWADQALAVGIWGRAALLVTLVVVFLRSEPAVEQWSEPERPPAAPHDASPPAHSESIRA